MPWSLLAPPDPASEGLCSHVAPRGCAKKGKFTRMAPKKHMGAQNCASVLLCWQLWVQPRPQRSCPRAVVALLPPSKACRKAEKPPHGTFRVHPRPYCLLEASGRASTVFACPCRDWFCLRGSAQLCFSSPSPAKTLQQQHKTSQPCGTLVMGTPPSHHSLSLWLQSRLCHQQLKPWQRVA